mmetsp:Transcript_37009/g.56748  ORF Transcript_37009/g.56748 Transcript_37009/m.56748 type:complete len:126 (+) Transcript_37009:1659-2036(+)
MQDQEYFNSKIERLNQQRLRVHELARKYRLESCSSVDRLAPVDIYGNGNQPAPYLNSLDPKERMRQYNLSVQSRQRKISSMLKDKRQWESPGKNIIVFNKYTTSVTGEEPTPMVAGVPKDNLEKP